MSLKDKADDSIRLAYSLVESGDLNLAANRFYYSVFQKTLNFAKTKHDYDYNNIEDSKKKGTHNSLIHHLSYEISKARQKNPGNKALNKISNIQSDFSKLKKMREKADYSEFDITEDDLESIQSSLKQFNEKYSTMLQNL